LQIADGDEPRVNVDVAMGDVFFARGCRFGIAFYSTR
jgi:hypothetical protein